MVLGHGHAQLGVRAGAPRLPEMVDARAFYVSDPSLFDYDLLPDEGSRSGIRSRRSPVRTPPQLRPATVSAVVVVEGYVQADGVPPMTLFRVQVSRGYGDLGGNSPISRNTHGAESFG